MRFTSITSIILFASVATSVLANPVVVHVAHARAVVAPAGAAGINVARASCCGECTYPAGTLHCTNCHEC
jgi:hypothetical protein